MSHLHGFSYAEQTYNTFADQDDDACDEDLKDLKKALNYPVEDPALEIDTLKKEKIQAELDKLDPALKENIEKITCDVKERINNLDYTDNEPLNTKSSLRNVLLKGVTKRDDIDRINKALEFDYEFLHKKTTKTKTNPAKRVYPTDTPKKVSPLAVRESWWTRFTRYLSSFFRKTQKGGKRVERRRAKFTEKHKQKRRRSRRQSYVYPSSFFNRTQRGGGTKIRWVEKRDALDSLGLPNAKFTKKHKQLLKRLKINSDHAKALSESDWRKLIREEDRRLD